jgi:hypothetical membrane protein
MKNTGSKSEGSNDARRGLKPLAIGGIVAPVVFTIFVAVESLLRPGYDQISQPISALGADGTPNAILQNVNFLVTGSLIVAFGYGLYRELGDDRGSKIGALLVIAFGALALVGDSIFHCDPGCPKDNVSFSQQMHGLFAFSGFIAITVAPFFVWRTRITEWQPLRSYSLVAGVVFVLLTFVVTPLSLGGPLAPMMGLVQRLYIAAVFLWIEFMAVRLLRLSMQSQAVEARPPKDAGS